MESPESYGDGLSDPSTHFRRAFQSRITLLLVSDIHVWIVLRSTIVGLLSSFDSNQVFLQIAQVSSFGLSFLYDRVCVFLRKILYPKSTYRFDIYRKLGQKLSWAKRCLLANRMDTCPFASLGLETDQPLSTLGTRAKGFCPSS